MCFYIYKDIFVNPSCFKMKQDTSFVHSCKVPVDKTSVVLIMKPIQQQEGHDQFCFEWKKPDEQLLTNIRHACNYIKNNMLVSAFKPL